MKIAASLLFAIPLGVPAFAGDLAPVALNSLSAAPAKIVAAPVLDQNGSVIGKVRAIVTDQDGKPSAMSYVTERHLAVIAAQAVSYDAQNNRVIADTSKAKLGEQVAVN